MRQNSNPSIDHERWLQSLRYEHTVGIFPLRTVLSSPNFQCRSSYNHHTSAFRVPDARVRPPIDPAAKISTAACYLGAGRHF